jgi:heme/copper-type cytochrome/quinol oxidase subunit 4
VLRLVRTPVTLVWALLMAATGVSMWVAVEQGVSVRTAATAIVMSVALVKAYLVGMYFMELRHAPWPLRAAFQAWCAICAAAVLGTYALSQ